MAFIPIYIFVLATTIVVDYFAAIQIEQSKGHVRRLWLLASIISTCVILFFFKYYDFFVFNVDFIAEMLHKAPQFSPLHLILPIGLSFHTFQSLSYVIEVYRGDQRAERHFGIYSLYVMFYPQLVAGPIERPQNLLHQFYEHHHFDYDRVVSGLRLMAWGLFKKAVIADRLATYVSAAYADPKAFDGGTLLVATLFFSFQIYCDFSGYTDIARGAARVMGFDLMLNFNRPYFATSISDFWRRWHISLSTWLRDYIYEPTAIGLRSWGKAGIVFGLMLTFLISGFWHGANWTFVIWGLLHGLALSLEAIFAKPRKRLERAVPPFLFKSIMLFITFSFVSFTYIFFRAQSISDGLLILNKILAWLLSPGSHAFIGHYATVRNVATTLNIPERFSESVALILFLIAAEALQSRINIERTIIRSPWWIRWPGYECGILAIVFLGKWLGARSFIYFQF